MATVAATQKGSDLPPRSSWRKSRFMRRGSNKEPREQPEQQSEAGSGTNQSLSAKRTQKAKKGGGIIRKLKTSFRKDRSVETFPSAANESDSSPSNPQSPFSGDSFVTVESEIEKKNVHGWNEAGKERGNRDIIYQKQRMKERDGFCRRVDTYDGQVIVVDQKPTYEIGNYLGGGVAGVVYEGHRLRPMEEYPVRTGIRGAEKVVETPLSPETESGGFFCAPVDFVQTSAGDGACGDVDDAEQEETVASPTNLEAEQKLESDTNLGKSQLTQEAVDVAIEATVSQNQHGVMLDAQDAPSRSKHYTKAASVQFNPRYPKREEEKSLQHGLPDESVAIKILNPVGYRILQSDGLKGAVIVKKGESMDIEVKKGMRPMQEKHVWWLVNPNSRNLRTLQRYNGKSADGKGTSGVQVDRGSASKGLRLSLIAAYIDPRTDQLRELTLTRCIEIWGHIPFNATDMEFEDMMTAIERVNAGQPPPPVPAFMSDDDHPPSRVGTDATATSAASLASESGALSPVHFKTARTGLLRAALTHRTTVFCDELNAYIAIPAVPSKYLRWLRQRRAATKEIRNMMSIGRHKNVLHLFEVLEYIQDSKSTMFLILELVKGGELFDLISNNAGKNRNGNEDNEASERMMRKFFYELSSGVYYCHQNGIAHRDLKPENLLVHTDPSGDATLKIADFGLSAAFGPNAKNQISDTDTMIDSLGSPMSQASIDGDPSSIREGALSPSSQNSVGTIKDSMDKFIQSGANALSFLTCGAMETVLCIPNGGSDPNGASALRRMTSVVGSPHYVAPEIISQTDDGRGGRKKSTVGYDGSKADVWSAGVILYAMLFRSLPFGEDLLRCPRYQSYKKWYEDVRELGGRRSSAAAALSPNISESDERDFLGPHWFFPASTSKESRDLIVAMLNPKPEDRLSVGQILQHQWVAPER